jgi:hypothetical protein
MADTVNEVLLWLFVINLGVACGAGLYESRITVPLWLSFSPKTGYRWNAEAARQANVGIRFWVFVTTVPLSLFTLASLVAVFWTRDPVRSWWLGSVLAELVSRVMTGAYFIPTMIKLMGNDDPTDSRAAAKALQWARLAYIRLAVTAVAWLAALKALSLLYAHGG